MMITAQQMKEIATHPNLVKKYIKDLERKINNEAVCGGRFADVRIETNMQSLQGAAMSVLTERGFEVEEISSPGSRFYRINW